MTKLESMIIRRTALRLVKQIMDNMGVGRSEALRKAWSISKANYMVGDSRDYLVCMNYYVYCLDLASEEDLPSLYVNIKVMDRRAQALA